MEKFCEILYTSALTTYDLIEKNQYQILQLVSIFLPKETRDFILKKDFKYNTYYSKTELKYIEKQKKKYTKRKEGSSIKTGKQPSSLTKSINKPKIQFLIKFIPDNLLFFFLFFSYTSIHSILFLSFIFILLFVTDIHYLLITLFLLIINMTGIISFSNCPIHILEKKYRKKLTNNQDILCNIIKKIYDQNVNNNFEDSIEKLVTAIFLFFIKINVLILYRFFVSRLSTSKI